MTALVIAEHDHGTLKGATLNTVTAAASCGGDVHVLDRRRTTPRGAAQAAAQIAGVAKVLHADAAQPRRTAGGERRRAGAGHGGATTVTSSSRRPPTARTSPRAWPRKLDVAQVSDIIKVISPDTFERPIYAGNAIATVQSTDAVKVITVRTTGFDPAAATGGSAAIENARRRGRQRHVAASSAARSPRATGPNSPQPRSSSAAAARWVSSDKFNEVLTPLADKLGAALGASRAAVDAGYAPNDWQVGQTGKIVAPQLYIACGISGAIQHLAGMKDSKVIVAINKDPEAPIFSVADYGLVADVFTAVPELVKAL